MMARDFPRKGFILLILLALCSQSACNIFGGRAPSEASINVTQAYATVNARVTRSVALTSFPIASPTRQKNSPAPSDPPAPTSPPTGTQTSGQSSPIFTPTVRLICDKAAPGSPIDVTIPDNTRLFPGQAFTKVWRLANIGHCKWSSDYTAEWFSGERFGDTRVVSLGAQVARGESVDISVDMVAPLLPGTYQSNWKLRNPTKEWFGIGPNGDQVFWVRIVVVQVNTSTPSATASEIPPSATPTPTLAATVTPTVTITPTATPAVLIRASVILTSGLFIDLDTAQLNTGGEDLAFQKDAANRHWFAPQSGAVLGVYGASAPSLQICLSANMSAAPIPMESLSPGTTLCYRTDQGRTGWLRYDSFDPEKDALGLSILTWASP